MNENRSYQEYFKSTSKIFEFAFKKWRFLLSVFIVSAILAIVFSGPKFIAPKFEAQAVVYPANLGGYSGETRLEQMFQYLQSNVIRDSIIKKFKLYEEYQIDSTKPTSKNAVIKEYSNHIEFNSTKFESVEMLAKSKDPKKSKAILDEVIKLLDEIIRKTEREKYYEHVVIDKRLLEQKKNQLDSMQAIVTELSTKYGILDYIVQTEMVTEGYMKFLLEGKKGKDFEEVKELYNNLKKYGRYYHDLNAQLNSINNEFLGRLNHYEMSVKDYEKYLTHSYVIVEPEVPDKKVSPVRWLIVVMASLSSVLFTFIILLYTGAQKDSDVE